MGISQIPTGPVFGGLAEETGKLELLSPVFLPQPDKLKSSANINNIEIIFFIDLYSFHKAHTLKNFIVVLPLVP